MGGTVKQLAIVAVAAFVAIKTGQAQFLIGALGSAGATAVGALAGGLVATIAGKALGIGKVDLEEVQPIGSYATTTLKNDGNNNNVVPIIYGEARVGGNREFADLQTGSNVNLYEIITFAGHEVNSFVDLLANNQNMTQGTGGDTDKYRFASDKILVKVYTKKPAGAIQAITSYTAGTWNETALSGITFQNTTFADTDLPDGICFAVVHHIYDASNNNQRKDITAIIEGKKIRPLVDSSTIGSTPAYSNNPAEIMLDFLTDENNFNELDGKIDIESFYNSKILNNSYGFSCNLAFNTKTNRSAAMQEILATHRGQLIYSQGKFKLKQDEANRVEQFSLTDDDIISGSFSWSQKKARDIANKVVVSFIEPIDQWQTKKTEIEDGDLITSDGRTYAKEINLRGVTSQAQADKIKELALNQFRYSEDSEGARVKVTPLFISFTTTIKNSTLEVGDMGSVDTEQLPNKKQFVIVGINTKQSGELIVSAVEYSNTHYKDSLGNAIIS